MRVAVAATPEVAIPTLDWLTTSEHELAFVITRPDQPAGRGRTLQESPISLWTKKNKVPVLKPQKVAEISVDIASVDLVITIGYGVLLPIEILKLPKFGFINLHFSLLPAWRGAAPVQRAIQNGDRTSGVTVFALDQGMDTGPIYLQEKIAIEENENSAQVLEKMSRIGPPIIKRTLELISHGVEPTPQPKTGASLAPKLTRAEAEIMWSEAAPTIVSKVLAFTPKPGAWTFWKGARLEILKLRANDSDDDLAPGVIRLENKSIIVGCGDKSSVLIEIVKPAGKNEMTADAWSNGARPTSGDSFG